MEEVVVRQKQALIFTQISKMIKAFCILLVSEMCKAMGTKPFLIHIQKFIDFYDIFYSKYDYY